MEKKGQLTIFIIVGIVLLISIGIFLAMRMTSQTPTDIISPTESPVQKYVESCLYTTAYEGLIIQGENGGFIDLPDQIKYSPRAYIRNDLFGNIEYPMWYYDGINNTPTLEYANSELTKYITKNVMQCINFSGFKDINVTPVRAYPVIQVIYAEEDTVIRADYPVIITTLDTGDVNKDLRKYESTVPVRFKKVFSAATNIIAAENKDSFIERKVIDLIAMAGEESIPYTGIEFSCGNKKWFMSKITARLKELIGVNFPYIKFKNLYYNKDKFISIPEPNTPQTYENSYFNLHYVWDAGISPDDNLRATVVYDDNFPFYMHATPSSGGILRANAQKSQGIASLLCINVWHFNYDISFPVIIRIKDMPHDNVPEYVFEYGTRIMVNHNQPDRKTVASNVYEPSALADADVEEYCDGYTDFDQLIMVRDKDTLLEIDNVNITFVCGFMSCSLGKTDNIANMGNIPALRAKAPHCVNAVLKATKKGYLDATLFGDVNTEFPGTYDIEMTRIKDFRDIQIVKHMMVDDKDVSTQETPLLADETATVTLTMRDNPNYGSYITYPAPEVEGIEEGEAAFEGSMMSSSAVRLIFVQNATYHVSIIIINMKTGKITGAYEADWNPDIYNLDKANRIKFHAVAMAPSDDEYKDYLFFQGIPSYSEKVSQPELMT